VSGNQLRRGFTLIELLVVMAIIAMLLSLAAPRYFRTLEHSKETVLKHDLSVMREAIDRHYGDLGQYPDTLSALVDKHYLRSVPVDPFMRSPEDWQLIASEDPDHPGVRDVRSVAAGKASDGSAFTEW
jgi:general secretion pathway protein G